MLALTVEPSGAVLADVAGQLTLEDQERLRDALIQAISKHRQGRLLLGLHDFDYDAQDANDIWFDVKSAAFLKGLMRMAVVTEPVHTTAYERFTFMAPFRTKVFSDEQRADAIVWLDAH